MQYDNTNSGVFYRNSYKKKKEQPDFTGEINVNGIEKTLSIWENVGKSGTPYFKIICNDPKPKEDNAADQQNAVDQQPNQTAGKANLDDDIPF